MEKEFVVAGTIKQAVQLRERGYVFLAGGTEINRLNSTVKFDSLVSVKKLGLNCISDNGKYISIGSMCTFQEVIDNKKAPSYLKKACMFMASRTKRNMATIGGNIALCRFDSYIIPTLVAANAKLHLQNIISDIEINVIDYIEKNKDYQNFLILEVLLPKGEFYLRSSRVANTELSHAVITVSMRFDGKKFNLFAGLSKSGFVNLPTLTQVLSKKLLLTQNDVLNLVNSSEDIKFRDDIFGSADYKKYILAVNIFNLYCQLKGDAK